MTFTSMTSPEISPRTKDTSLINENEQFTDRDQYILSELARVKEKITDTELDLFYEYLNMSYPSLGCLQHDAKETVLALYIQPDPNNSKNNNSFAVKAKIEECVSGAIAYYSILSNIEEIGSDVTISRPSDKSVSSDFLVTFSLKDPEAMGFTVSKHLDNKNIEGVNEDVINNVLSKTMPKRFSFGIDPCGDAETSTRGMSKERERPTDKGDFCTSIEKHASNCKFTGEFKGSTLAVIYTMNNEYIVDYYNNAIEVMKVKTKGDASFNLITLYGLAREEKPTFKLDVKNSYENDFMTAVVVDSVYGEIITSASSDVVSIFGGDDYNDYY